MAIRIGINGFGRIGRLFFRALRGCHDIEVLAINDLADAASLANLLKYDSVHGKFEGQVTTRKDGDKQYLVVDGANILVTSEKDPSKLPWGTLGVAIVFESTGRFTDVLGMRNHITAGAKKVLLSAPPKSPEEGKPQEVKTIVMGVNDKTLAPSDTFVSNASCTTNCLAPVVKVLHETFGVEYGLMTTCHAYTNDQVIADFIHKDPRRARAGAINIIPTSTGAAKAVGEVIPELKGKLSGISLRVPVPDGSIVDFVAMVKKDVTKEDVNAAMKKAAEGPLKGLLEYTEDPIVSSDVIGNPVSSLFDAASTMVMQKRMVKVLSWYDNEWGYSKRCVDLIRLMAK